MVTTGSSTTPLCNWIQFKVNVILDFSREAVLNFGRLSQHLSSLCKIKNVPSPLGELVRGWVLTWAAVLPQMWSHVSPYVSAAVDQEPLRKLPAFIPQQRRRPHRSHLAQVTPTTLTVTTLAYWLHTGCGTPHQSELKKPLGWKVKHFQYLQPSPAVLNVTLFVFKEAVYQFQRYPNSVVLNSINTYINTQIEPVFSYVGIHKNISMWTHHSMHSVLR